MKIVFYSTNSNVFDSDNSFITTLPSWKDEFSQLHTKHPDLEIICVSQKPAMFLIDKEDLQFLEKTYSDHSHILLENDNPKDFADFIVNLNPDLVIAASFWTAPFDWLPIQDSIIKDELEKSGIKTICHPLKVTHTFFDKFQTHQLFDKLSFNVPKALFISHDLFFCAGNKREVKTNVYKNSIFSQIKQLKLPVIVKDNVGLSSYGMQVINTYGEVFSYLNSKKNNSDRLIEEYIEGEQFGCEIYGTPGNYKILPPFMFSTNQYGITSPKQSVKIGPIKDAKYDLSSLYKMLLDLAEKTGFSGFAQVDLIFSNNKWFIIEVNPRLSGMTTTYKSAFNCNFYEMLLNGVNVLQSLDFTKLLYTVNLKFPLLSDEYLVKLSKVEAIKFISQIENKAAKQEREKGYCEVIISEESPAKLKMVLESLRNDFSEIVEPSFIETSLEMLKYL